MKPFLVQLTIAGVILTAHSLSADSQLDVPVLGYVFDPAARGIRPVLGSPGASLLSDPVDAGVAVAWSVVSPRQDFAILTSTSDAAVRILSLPPGDLSSRILTGAAGIPQKIVFGPGGETAGLYHRDEAKFQMFTHLPQDPALAHEIDLTGLSGSLLSAAVSDDGELALLLTGDSENTALWLSYGGATPVPLEAPAGTSAMGFQSAGRDAVLATRDGQVYLLQNLAAGPSLRVLAPADNRTAHPVAVGSSPDGGRAYVATRQGTIAVFGVGAEGATFLSCGCKPSGLFPLHSRMMIRLNEISDGQLMLLDTSNLKPRIWFVPAVVTAPSSDRSAQ
jgi:hypothetical protein